MNKLPKTMNEWRKQRQKIYEDGFIDGFGKRKEVERQMSNIEYRITEIEKLRGRGK